MIKFSQIKYIIDIVSCRVQISFTPLGQQTFNKQMLRTFVESLAELMQTTGIMRDKKKKTKKKLSAYLHIRTVQ